MSLRISSVARPPKQLIGSTKVASTKKSSVSQNIKFSVINTANKDKKYLYRGGNKMTSIQLNELKNKYLHHKINTHEKYLTHSFLLIDCFSKLHFCTKLHQ